MSRKIRDLYLLLMYLLSAAGIALVVVQSGEAMWSSLITALLWLASFTVRNLFLYNVEFNRKYIYVTYLIEIIIVTTLGLSGAGESVNLLLCITLGDCFVEYKLGGGLLLLFTIILGRVFVGAVASPLSGKGIIEILFNITPMLTLTALIAYLLGKLLKSNTLLEESVRKVEEREVKLRSAYHELGEAYKSLEEMATVKERNRIAREIHDIVGHTLTTVIVEMEVGKMLADRDEIKSRQKYEMAHIQAVKALNEMRASVRMLEEREQREGLTERVKKVVDNTSEHTGVAIRSIIEFPYGTRTPYDDLILRALSELIANGIRHGKSTAFLLKLELKEQVIHLLIQDNGGGCESINFGFGLRNMKKGIEAAGGKISFSSEVGEGFETKIELPLKGESR